MYIFVLKCNKCEHNSKIVMGIGVSFYSLLCTGFVVGYIGMTSYWVVMGYPVLKWGYCFFFSFLFFFSSSEKLQFLRNMYKAQQ